MIELSSLATFTAAYPTKSATLTHVLHQDPLFSIPRLTILAQSLPNRRVRVTRETAETDQPSTPPTLILQGIEGLNARVEIIEFDCDTTYAELTTRITRPLAPLTKAAHTPIGEMSSVIDISSPRLSSRHHADVSYLLILQCRGSQTITIGDSDDKELNEGHAIFIPQGTSFAQQNGQTASVSLQIRWTSAESSAAKGMLGQFFSKFKRP